jgi:hypothetical protein
MKRKTFLITSLMLASFSIGQAQTYLFQNGFEGDNTDNTATGWYEFINTQNGDTREVNAAAAYTDKGGSYGCHFYNDATYMGNTWLRAIKFRNLHPKEGISYRLSFYIKGDNQYTDTTGTSQTSKAQIALMCGEENADVPFLASDSTRFDYSISGFSDTEFKKYTMMFFYANAAVEKQYYLNHKNASSPDAELADKFFATINIYNPGDYYIDDVEAIESSIAGIYYNQDMIKVDFGYATNITSLAKTVKSGKLQLDNSCVTVTVNDTPIDIASVEVHSDGYMYIFLGGDNYPKGGDDNVVVSFNNPSTNQLLYSTSLRPNSFNDATKVVQNFSNEKAEYDENIDVTSVAYNPPTLVSSDPENASFDLPLTTKSITMNFDKPINIDKAKATITGGSIKNETLIFTPSTGFAQDITLTRSGTAELTKGEYSINITKLFGKLSYADDIFNDTTITINLGNSVADPNDTSYVAWTDSFSVLGANYCPKGWTVYNGTSVLTPGASVGSGPRVFAFTKGGDVNYAMYIRAGSASYGKVEGWPLTLKAGKYELTYNSFGWKATTTYNTCKVMDPDGNVIIKQKDNCLPNVNGSTAAVSGSTASTVDFKATVDGNYSISWTPGTETNDSVDWNEVMFGNVTLKYIPSTPGAYYKTLLSNALISAKTTAKNDTSARYAGDAYTALNTTINSYDGKSYTAPSAYLTATAALNTAKISMDNHRKLIDTYDPMVAAAQTIIATYADSKYANDASYPALQNVINKYEGQALTRDDSLQTAIDTLTFYTTKCSNMCKYVIDDLNDRLTMAIATAKKLGIPADDATITEATTSITDNDALAKNLRNKIKGQLYKNLGSPTDTTFSLKTDSTTLETYVDSIDMTCFLKNPNLYITTYTRTDVSSGACPGWTINTGSGYEVAWSVGWGTYDVSATRPAEDAMLTNWGKSFDISQTITDLPVGTYSLKVGFGERVATDTSHPDAYKNYFYIVTSSDSDSIQAPYVGQTFPINNMSINNVKITDGKLTIGAKAAGDAHVFLNNFAIFMKGKDETFNYATGMKGVSDNNLTLKSIQYFSINGQRLNKPGKGITIIKRTYSDGNVKVSKQITE